MLSFPVGDPVGFGWYAKGARTERIFAVLRRYEYHLPLSLSLSLVARVIPLYRLVAGVTSCFLLSTRNAGGLISNRQPRRAIAAVVLRASDDRCLWG